MPTEPKGFYERIGDIEMYWNEIRDIIASITKEMQFSALDIGCNDGSITVKLLEHFALVEGLEPHQETFEKAQGNLLEYYPKLLLRQWRIEDYVSAFPDKKYDWIFCLGVLQKLPEPTFANFIPVIKWIIKNTNKVAVIRIPKKYPYISKMIRLALNDGYTVTVRESKVFKKINHYFILKKECQDDNASPNELLP